MNVGYQFTATGASVPTDACGDLYYLPDALKYGVHGSSLNVEFRSNRIFNMDTGFFLAIVCISTTSNEPLTAQSHTQKRLSGPMGAPSSDHAFDLRQQPDCMPSQTLLGRINRSDTQATAEEYLVRCMTELIAKVYIVTVHLLLASPWHIL